MHTPTTTIETIKKKLALGEYEKKQALKTIKDISTPTGKKILESYQNSELTENQFADMFYFVLCAK